MTNKEAITVLENAIKSLEEADIICRGMSKLRMKFGIKTIEEMNSYIKIYGDRMAQLMKADLDGRCVVLSEPMKPMVYKPNDTDVYCPKCGQTLSGGWPLSDADDYRKLCQCPKCGQSIDDTKCEAAEATLKKECLK